MDAEEPCDEAAVAVDEGAAAEEGEQPVIEVEEDEELPADQDAAGAAEAPTLPQESAAAGGGAEAGGAEAAGEREALLDRAGAVLQRIGSLRLLERLVEQVEAFGRDYDERVQIKKDARAAAEELELARRPALSRQLAFYFSDANLRHDRYVREKIEEDEGGYVPIDFVLPFNRLRALGCTGAAEVAAAVEAAPAFMGIELSPCRGRLRRAGGAPAPPLAGDVTSPSQRDRRTVRVEGFQPGDEAVTPEAVRALFAGFGPVAHAWVVRERQNPRKPVKAPSDFTGVVEVEFETDEALAAAVAASPAPEWQGAPLRVQSLVGFRAERRAAPEAGGGAAKRLRPAEEGEGDGDAKRARLEEEAAASAARFPRGCVVRIASVPEGVSWIDIKDCFDEYGETVFCEMKASVDGDSSSAFVRMRSAEDAQAIIKAYQCGKFSAVFPDAPSQAEVAEPPPPAATATAPSSDPYGGGSEAPGPAPAAEEAAGGRAPLTDPYGGAAPEADDADAPAGGGGGSEEAEPFVVDVTPSAPGAGGLGAEPAAPPPAQAPPRAEAAVADGTAQSATRPVMAILAGGEEEAYLQSMAYKLAEKRKTHSKSKDGKGGKEGGKGGKGSKKGSAKDGGKGKPKGGKDKDKDGGTKGKPSKGKKGGKGGRRVTFADSDDSA